MRPSNGSYVENMFKERKPNIYKTSGAVWMKKEMNNQQDRFCQ